MSLFKSLANRGNVKEHVKCPLQALTHAQAHASELRVCMIVDKINSIASLQKSHTRYDRLGLLAKRLSSSLTFVPGDRFVRSGYTSGIRWHGFVRGVPGFSVFSVNIANSVRVACVHRPLVHTFDFF